MANNVEITVLSQLEKETTNIIANLKEIITLANKVLSNNKGSVSSPAGLSGQQTNNAALTASIKAQSAALTELQQKYNAIIQSQGKSTTSTRGNTSATRENSVANQILRAETDRNIRANTLLGGAYARASAQLLILKKQAKDYAIALGETHPKTLQAVKDANDFGNRIKSADAVVGDFQRNVGNYSGSLSKGFASAYSGLRQLAILIPGIGIAGLIGAASEAIIDLVKNIAGANKGIRTLAENRNDLNNAIKEGNKLAGDEIGKLDILYKTATNVNLSIAQREKAVNKLQELYPSYFANIDDEIIRNGKAKDSYLALRDAIFDSSRAKAVQNELEKRAQERFEKELKIRETIALYDERSINAAASESITNSRNDASPGITIKKTAEENRAIAKFQKAEAEKRLKEFLKASLKEDDLLLKAQEELYGKSAKLEADRIKTRGESQKKAVDDYSSSSIKAIEAQIEALKKFRDSVDYDGEIYGTVGNQINLLEVILKGLQQTAEKGIDVKLKINKEFDGSFDISDKKYIAELSEDIKKEFDEAYGYVDSLGEKHQGYVQYLSETQKATFRDLTEQYAQALDAGDAKEAAYIKKKIEDFQKYGNSIKSYIDTFKGIDGFGTLFKILNKEISGFGENFQATFLAITESAQEAFKFISGASDENFNAEYDRLERQKDVSIKFAGESTSAQESIQKQYEDRKRDIANREAKSKKQLAIFNILIDTAQAVVAALPNIPLSIAVGAIGLVEAGIVASQEVPRFFDGGVHKGGLMMVNDGGGTNYRETIVTPTGNVIQPSGRDVLMNAPAGTQIFTPDQWAFNEWLSGYMGKNGINMAFRKFSNMPNSTSSAGMSDDQINRIVSAISNQPGIEMKLDKKGLETYVIRDGMRKISMNNSTFIKTNIHSR